MLRTKQKNLDSVPGDGNCGFYSIAKIIVDLYRRGQLNESIASGDFDEFFNVYARHYPDLIDPNRSSLENIDHLISTMNPNDLMDTLAYTLRQYAVDRMVAEPANYRGAFADNTEGTDPTTMRRSGVWVDHGALHAVLSSLKIQAKVEMPGILDKRTNTTFTAEIYSGKSHCQEVVTLQLAGGHYQPYIAAETQTYFATNTTTNSIPKISIAEKSFSYQDPSMDEIKLRIQKAEDADLNREKRATKLLNQFNISDLLELYREKMQSSDYLLKKITTVAKATEGNAEEDFLLTTKESKLLESFFSDAVEEDKFVKISFSKAIKTAQLSASFFSDAVEKKELPMNDKGKALLKATLVRALVTQVHIEPDYLTTIELVNDKQPTASDINFPNCKQQEANQKKPSSAVSQPKTPVLVR